MEIIMAFRTWEDFLESKKQEDQPSKKVAEMKPSGDTPPQGKGANPYHGPHTSNPKQVVRVAEKSDKKPLGDEATPPFSNPKETIPNGEKPEKGNVKVEGFLEETRNMSNAEFVQHVIAENKDVKKKEEFDPTVTCQFSGRRVVPAFYEVARYMAHAIPQNEAALRTFVRELKGVDNGLPTLINELFAHRECYNEMCSAMTMPESVIPRRLARAMNESYSNWMNEIGMATGGMGAMPMSSPMGGSGGMFPNKPMSEAVDLPVDQRMDTGDDPDDDNDLSPGPPVPPDDAEDMPGGAGGPPPPAPTDNLQMPPPMGGGGGGPMGGMGGMMGGMPPMGGPGGMPPLPPGPGGPPLPGTPGPGGMVAPPMPGMPPQGAAGQPGMPPGGADPNAAGPKTPGMVDTPAPEQRPKKEFAFHHLAREMARYDPIKAVMQEVLGS
jgi:hypothetical protein